MVILDAHQRPPDLLRQVYKKYSKRDKDHFKHDAQVIDFASGLRSEHCNDFAEIKYGLEEQHVKQVFQSFLHQDDQLNCIDLEDGWHLNGTAYECKSIDGLTIVPALLPISVQKSLLSRIFHRDFSDPKHKTNVDLHYDMTRPTRWESLFDYDPTSSHLVKPKDSEVHKPLTVGQLLTKKLRWMTLGGQYDWTAKVYPNEPPPPFPEDIKKLLFGLFPQTTAEAAIVNLYSPGDTLSLHRDVSEECDQGLISVSIGCDCLFMLGLEDDNSEDATRGSEEAENKKKLTCVVMRLRSGDAVYMAGKSRFAWHGVPSIIPDTCPGELRSWPASPGDDQEGQSRYASWQNWMSNKRININVRQMKAN